MISFPLRVVLIVLIAWQAPVRSEDAHPSKSPYIQTEHYVDRTVAGWVVRVNKDLLTTRAEVGAKALSLLDTKLKEIAGVVPSQVLPHLQKVPIWLGVNDYEKPNAVYHPSAGWLETNGFNPEKAHAVEIPNAAIFLEWSDTQPMLVLHELAHAFHHQVIGYDRADLQQAYERAKNSGRYDKIPFAKGGLLRAYALNNVQEFFAEMSEAYFGRNDFFPFTREELRAHDPETFALIERLWTEPREQQTGL